MAIPYFVFMEAMVSHLIHGGTFFIFGAQVFLQARVRMGRVGHAYVESDDAIVWCIISLCSAMSHMDLIDVILSRMTSMSVSSM